MIKAVIFDWSGVISDDWETTYATTMEALELRGLKKMPMEEFRRLYDQPWTKFYENIGVSIDVKEEYALWEKILPKHMHRARLFPYAKKTLEWAKKNGVKAIILSARDTKSIHKEVADNKLEKLIDAIYSGHNNKKDKIHRLLEENGLNPKETLYVGDSTHDIDTARHAGIRSVAVLSGYDSLEKLRKERPDYILDSIGELPALVEKICEK